MSVSWRPALVDGMVHLDDLDLAEVLLRFAPAVDISDEERDGLRTVGALYRLVHRAATGRPAAADPRGRDARLWGRLTGALAAHTGGDPASLVWGTPLRVDWPSP